MKNLIFVTLFLFSLFGFTQELKCCKTVEEVKNMLKGNWKDYQDLQKVIYQFNFSESSGIIDEFVKTDDDEFITLECPTYINIEKKEEGFKINYLYMVSSEVFDIIFLNYERFIIKNKNSEIEYVKIKD